MSFIGHNSGGQSRHNSQCKVIPISGKRQRPQTVDFVRNRGIRKSVLRQYRLRRSERTIANYLRLTQATVRTVVIEAIDSHERAA